jgi:hypothetical protein
MLPLTPEGESLPQVFCRLGFSLFLQRNSSPQLKSPFRFRGIAEKFIAAAQVPGMLPLTLKGNHYRRSSTSVDISIIIQKFIAAA